jgi:methyl-accepting chemotaxis protein
MNSLAKKVTFLQVIIISLSMLGFILYISLYLGSYIERETEKKIESEISHLTQTVTVYNGAIEDTAVKLFSMFEAGFGTFFVNPDEKSKSTVWIHHSLLQEASPSTTILPKWKALPI